MAKYFILHYIMTVGIAFLKKEMVELTLWNWEVQVVKEDRLHKMRDCWPDGQSKSITNLLVNSPSETVFLESIDTTAIYKPSEELFKLMDSVIQKIREEIITQIITNGTNARICDMLEK